MEFYTGVGTTLDAPVMLPPLCHDHVATVRSAVLYEKPTTIVAADYVWRRTDRWIEFPWSS